ncbi:hypothetical protein CEP54_016290 [Fusarium duplospermum]|uniref:Uncharacterized protein n=1 Tax=Fusarium duplospermum TaxID=1325734 RepID=A0A428NFQ6_9HYPO|nr:hypothetical protein CEP54_016290 [Fusarium duplospermum]
MASFFPSEARNPYPKQQYLHCVFSSAQFRSFRYEIKSLSLPDSQGIFCPIVVQLCKTIASCDRYAFRQQGHHTSSLIQ